VTHHNINHDTPFYVSINLRVLIVPSRDVTPNYVIIWHTFLS